MGSIARMMACTALLASARVASAEGNSPTAAQELFDSAKADAKAEDFRAAVAKFSKSYRLDPKPGTLRNVAYCEEQLGRLASALKHYRELAEKFPTATEHVKFASERAVELEKRVPRLTIKRAEGVPTETKITLDDEEIAQGDIGTALPVDPGEHEILVTAQGHKARQFRITLREGERNALYAVVGEKIAQRSASDAFVTGVANTRAPESGSANLKTLGYVVGGVGLLGLAVGVIYGVKALSDSSTADSNCIDATRTCNQTGKDADAAGRKDAPISTAGFVVGALGAGLGTYLVLSARSERSAENGISAAFGPRGAQVVLRRKW